MLKYPLIDVFFFFKIFPSFAVGSFVEGKEPPNTRVRGRILSVVGTGRHIKFYVQFVNGNVAVLAAVKLWPRLMKENDLDFDEELDADHDAGSVSSVGSKVSIASSKSDRSALVEMHEPIKKRY